jgi:hypothetical protein
MTTTPVKNVSASVRAKLLELSRSNGEQFNFILTRYALERLLYRLGKTNQDKFVLKGAMLFALWTARARHRPTVDMDLLAYGPPSLDNIRSIFQTAAALAADDGMSFLPETARGDGPQRPDGRARDWPWMRCSPRRRKAIRSSPNRGGRGVEIPHLIPD